MDGNGSNRTGVGEAGVVQLGAHGVFPTWLAIERNGCGFDDAEITHYEGEAG